MNDELKALLELVEDEATYVTLINALAEDWKLALAEESQIANPLYGQAVRGWENGNVGSFLGAASTWANSADHPIWGYDKSENPWRRAADIIVSGKHYKKAL